MTQTELLKAALKERGQRHKIQKGGGMRKPWDDKFYFEKGDKK